MPTDVWLNETLYPAWGQRFRVVRELARTKSAFQDIAIFESETHGRVMVLDGVIQIAEGDEFVYQEMLVHVPLLAHGAAANVLIIGAGYGGVSNFELQLALERARFRNAVPFGGVYAGVGLRGVPVGPRHFSRTEVLAVGPRGGFVHTVNQHGH